MQSPLEHIITKFGIDTSQPSPIMIRTGTRNDLARLFAELEYKKGAEIGVEQGRYSEILCKNNPGLRLYCVDPWRSYREYRDTMGPLRLKTFYEEAKNRLAPYNCEIIRKFSAAAVADFAPASLDFVYIDANHHFDYVAPDIILWSKIVRSGGIVSGHDYRPDKSERVPFHIIQATHAYTSAHKITPWFVLKGEGNSTWFWVKP